MKPELPLFTLWYDFIKLLFTKTEKFPKSVRFSFTNRINNLALDIIEGIVEARYSTAKAEILKRVDLQNEKLRILLRICHDLGYLDHKGYEFSSRKINEAGKMIGGWRNYDREREN